MSADTQKASLPLEGISVLELASVLAGPSVGTLLSELGAEVLKIENPDTGGDVTRGWKSPGEDPDASVSAYYASANGGKSVRMLRLGTAASQSELEDLIRKADIVLTSFKPGSDKKLQLDPSSVVALNPTVILARIKGYGGEDPRPAFDLVIQAESGFMSMNGSADGPPLKMPVALIDVLAAHQLKEGILTALILKLKSGKGSLVEVSLMDAALSALANQAGNYLNADLIPSRMGTLHPNIAPYGEQVICKDDKAVLLAVGSEKQFQSLCSLLDMPELASNPSFVNNAARVKNRIQLLKLLSPAFRGRDRESWLQILQQSAVPAGAVRNLQEVFAEPSSKNMIACEMHQGKIWKRTRQQAFRILNWEEI